MKNKRKIYSIFIICIVIFGVMVGTKNSFSEELDPLVTQSYVEMRVEQIKEYFETQFSTVKKDPSSTSTEDISKYIRFIPIELKVGDELIGGEGSEIVLRSGKAKSMSNKQGGLLDVTDGVDLQESQMIPLHHLIVIPRDDGRGIRVTSTNAFVMVKGPYEIK